jgi:hypothetical protein
MSECLDPGDVESICRAFGGLISRLPENVIVILVVDGLRFFAQPQGRRQEMIVTINHLAAVNRNGSAATLKFLFANSARCEYLEHIFTEDEYLRIPKDIVSGGGYTEWTWKWPDPVEG